MSDGQDVNVRDAGGRTPLMRAIEWGNPDFCMVLISARADASLTQTDGKTAVDFSDSGSTVALVRALLGEPFRVDDCQQALEAMRKDQRRDALKVISEWADEHDRTAAERRARGAEVAAASEQEKSAEANKEVVGTNGLANQRRAGSEALVGKRYEVQFQSKLSTIAVRQKPSIASSVVGKKSRGDIVLLLELDETKNWARVEAPGSTEGTGWLMIRHRDLGDFVVPAGN